MKHHRAAATLCLSLELVLAAIITALPIHGLHASAHWSEPVATPSPTSQPARVRFETSDAIKERSVLAPGSRAGWTTIMTEDFEGVFPGATWTVGGDPGWGKESYRSHHGSWSAYCAGGGAHGVDPPGPYANNMQTTMIYGPFDLSDASDAELLFHMWNRTEPYNDVFGWGASIDGAIFHGQPAWGDSGGWQAVNFDLTTVYMLGDLTGEPRVWIGFYFQSNGSNTDEGAYVDDIVLRKLTDAPAEQHVYLPHVTRAH